MASGNEEEQKGVIPGTGRGLSKGMVAQFQHGGAVQARDSALQAVSHLS